MRGGRCQRPRCRRIAASATGLLAVAGRLVHNGGQWLSPSFRGEASWLAHWVLRVAFFSFLTTLALLAADKDGATDPAKTDADFAFQGEYAGMVEGDDGDKKIGVQVIALGEGQVPGGRLHAAACPATAGTRRSPRRVGRRARRGRR